MTSITPDLATEEGAKLLTYKPGQTVMLEFEVQSVTDTELTGVVTKCEPVEETEDGEYEDEAPAPMMGGKGMPKAVVIVATGKK